MSITSPELTYNPEQDELVFVQGRVDFEGGSLVIDAGTAAGRRQPDDPPKPNEDAFGIVRHDHLLGAAVFDGASSQKTIPELGNTSGARYASHSLKEMFEAGDLSDARLLLTGLNRKLGARFHAFDSADYTDLNSLPTSTGTIACFDSLASQLNISHVGDTFAAALFTDGTTELLTNNLHRQFDVQVLELIKTIALSQSITPREARKDPRVGAAIMQMFQDTRNRPDGTGEGMINGDPNMDQYIHTASLPLAGLRAVLLGSDGLVPPDMDITNQHDRRMLIARAHITGVRGLIRHVRKIEDHDPDRWHLRFKHADDATGVLIEVSQGSQPRT